MTVSDLSLKVVDCRLPEFRQSLNEFIDAGSNFLIIVPADDAIREEISDLLQMPETSWLKPLDKTTILTLILHLHDEDFFQIRAAHVDGASVCLIEQLVLPTVNQPNFEQYLVYCQIRGIMSRHRTWEAAKRAWGELVERVSQVAGFPEPSIFHWDQKRWVPEHRPREAW